MSGRILSSVFTINKKTTLLETFSLYSNNERKKKPEINRSIDHYKSYFSLSLSPVLSRPSWEGKMIGRQNEERRRRRQEAVNSSTFNILYKFITRNKISSARDEKEKWRFAEMKRGGGGKHLILLHNRNAIGTIKTQVLQHAQWRFN